MADESDQYASSIDNRFHAAPGNLSQQRDSENPTLTSLFFSFLKLGATAFGGPAMVPYMGTMAVEQKGWLNAQTFREGVALCQTIPGATASAIPLALKPT